MRHSHITVVIIVALALISGTIWYLKTTGRDLKIGTLLSMRQPPAGWSEYRSERYGFSLFYPEEMAVNEFDEGAGANTITFESAEKGLGFQIFAVPYSGEQVSEERFLRDVSSGIRQNPSDSYIDGALATSFYSKSIELGETREVWFIHNGFLYEVTTYEELDSWLAQILSTWHFD